MIHCENAEIKTLVKERLLIDRQAGFLAYRQARRPIFHKQAVV